MARDRSPHRLIILGSGKLPPQLHMILAQIPRYQNSERGGETAFKRIRDWSLLDHQSGKRHAVFKSRGPDAEGSKQQSGIHYIQICFHHKCQFMTLVMQPHNAGSNRCSDTGTLLKKYLTTVYVNMSLDDAHGTTQKPVRRILGDERAGANRCA